MPTKLDSEEAAALKEVASRCLCFKARKAARTLTRFYDRCFAGTKLEPAQFNILVAIRLSEPVPLATLASQLALDRTTFTRNLSLLQRDGLVKIRRGEDARKRLLSVTSAGKRAITKALPRWRRAQETALTILGQENSSRLSEALSLPTIIGEAGGE